MSNQKLGILAVVAAVMVLWAAVQSRLSSRTGTRMSGPAYLIQGLDPADIGRIVVGHGDDAVRIEQRNGRFVVTNEANYPADPKQINDLITKSLDVKTTEAYTDDPKNHEELEVTEEKARHVVKFFKKDGSLLTGVVIGKSQEAGQSTFVRRASDDTVYLAESAPWFRSGALDYVNQEIVSVKRDDVNAVTVTTPDGAYALRPKQDGDGVIFEGLPAGKKLKDRDAKSVFGALTSLRFEDVNQPADIEGVSFDHLYVCRLDDSTEYRLNVGKKDDKTYLMCEAKYTDTTPVTKKLNEVETEEQLKAKEAKLLADESAQKFTLRHKGWVYKVADYKAKYLTQKRSELLEDAEEEATEAMVEGPAQGPEPEQVTPSEPAVEPNAVPAPVVEPAAADPNA